MLHALDPLLERLRAQPFVSEIHNKLTAGTSLEVIAAAGSLRSILVAELFERRQTPVLWLLESTDEMEQAKIDAEHLLPVENSLLFRKPRKSRWGHDDIVIVSEQAQVLESLIAGKQKLVVSTAPALFTPVRSPDNLQNEVISLERGQNSDFEILIECLHSAGFERESTVGKPGDFAVRGGIVDVFPFTSDNPVRVEFWGDEIESIREFDTTSQRSVGNRDRIRIFPKPQLDGATTSTLLDHLPNDLLIVFNDSPSIERQLDDDKISGEQKKHQRKTIYCFARKVVKAP